MSARSSLPQSAGWLTEGVCEKVPASGIKSCLRVFVFRLFVRFVDNIYIGEGLLYLWQCAEDRAEESYQLCKKSGLHIDPFNFGFLKHLAVLDVLGLNDKTLLRLGHSILRL